MAADILIVDDEMDIRELVAGILEDEGYETRTAADSTAALRAIEERRPQLIYLDIWLQRSELDGLAILDIIREQHPDLPVVMISGHGNIETAVSAIKRGAYDYIEKPFKADRLVIVTERALEATKLRREVKDLRQRGAVSDELVGRSSAMNQVRQMIERVGPANSRVLIHGPSGSGKETVARAIHHASSRSGNAFVAINGAVITPDRMEEELFGVEDPQGGRKMTGALEEAHGGTLYLDEVADIPPETQSKILRVLVDQTFQRVGGGSKVRVDVRIISSTARDLGQEISAGRFREDLYHRLSVVPFGVPPLSDRREDIPDLVSHFMQQLTESAGLPGREISSEAMAVLQAHDWPGNVRQLKNNIERLVILTRGDEDSTVSADLLPNELGTSMPSVASSSGGQHLMALPLREAREIFERDYLQAQINRFGGNISRTADFVGMERSALHRKLKTLGLG
ncbi:MAG: sigma-54 dependent transcriptional regulator [Pseudomonadota bacterium]